MGALPVDGTARRASHASYLLGQGVGTKYEFASYEIQCHNIDDVPNAYALKSLYRSDGNYHLQIYSREGLPMQKTYCDFAGQISGASSIRYKEDICQVEDDLLEKMLGLQVIGFRYGEQAPEYVRDEKRHFGMIAEEVAEVMPDSVMLDQEELPTAVVYSDFIPLLLAQLQRQQKKLSALEQRIQKLEEGNKE